MISVSPSDASISGSTSDRHSFELVRVGVALCRKDVGYWDSENLVAQLKDIAIPALKKAHPG